MTSLFDDMKEGLEEAIAFANGEGPARVTSFEPKTLDKMTREELNAKLQHSYEQSLRGEVRPYQEVFKSIGN